MSHSPFKPEKLAAAHVDYQVKVEPVGHFPSELSSVLLTGAFPLSSSPTPSAIEGIKVFTYQQRYLCFCWFFFAGRTDEQGRQTNSSRVLIFPLESWQGVIPTLTDSWEWLKNHDLENMTDHQFYEQVRSLETSTLSPTLVKKAQEMPWFPTLLSKVILQKKVILLASNPTEALPWLEVLWYYTPDFLRFKLDWSSYAWSLKTDHEAVIIAAGEVEPSPKLSFWKRLFKPSSSEKTPLRFDTIKGISSQSNDLDSKPLEWVCYQWIKPQPWPNWQPEEQSQFLLEALKQFDKDPHSKLTKLIAQYANRSNLQELTDLIK